MRAATIWLCLGILWLIDTGFALRRQDLRQALVAGIVALGFLGVGAYFVGKQRPRRD